MRIDMIPGEDARLYQWVGPLVMNIDVLAYNHNYPFKTSASHCWFIARRDDDSIAGFMPVLCKGRTATINNYYVANDTPDVFAALLQKIVAELSQHFTLVAVAQTRHRTLFASLGFTLSLQWTKYIKMIYSRHATKCL